MNENGKEIIIRLTREIARTDGAEKERLLDFLDGCASMLERVRKQKEEESA
jgi:hypothetical protein